ASRSRDVVSEDPDGGHGKLDEIAAAGSAITPGAPGRIRNAVAVVVHGHDARITANAELGEHIERPERRARDREERRAVTHRALPCELAKNVDRALQLRAKDIRALPIDERVRLAMRSDLVAAAGNRLHEIWMALGDVRQREERRAHPRLVEQREQPLASRPDP